MANPDLPHEILLEIFSRLPAKSVGKCRTLSKSWSTHLSTPNFIKKHLIMRKQTIQQENVVLTKQRQNKHLYIITSPTKDDEFCRDKWLPDKCVCVSGSCNGLILVNCERFFLLVNPITLKQVTITRPSCMAYNASVLYGFGYDFSSDDYKIVILFPYTPKNGDGLVMTIDVYSVKNGVWKMSDEDCYPSGAFVPKSYAFEGGAFLNGALHWILRNKEGYCSCITAFDLSSEVFSEIPLSREFVRQLRNESEYFIKGRRGTGVSVVGGSLLIFDNNGKGATDIWIMKKYGVAESWVKFRTESEDSDYMWDWTVATLCYVKDEELLCLTRRDYLFSCDLKGETVRKVELGGCDARYSHGMAFVDSLVSPEDHRRRMRKRLLSGSYKIGYGSRVSE